MNAQQLRNSILQEAIQGRLVPQDPTDEPASVLLQRIRKEKERLVKEGKLKKKDLESKPIGDDEIPFEIPKGWEWCRFIDVAKLITDGTHSTPKYKENGVPFISVKDISNGKLSFSNCKYISQSEHEELKKRCYPQKGDILLSKVGTTGVPVIVNVDVEFSIFVSVALIKFFSEEIDSQYLIFLINSPFVQDQARKNTRGVGNKNWVINDISNTLLIIPPLPEQRRIVAKIEELLPLVEQYGKAQAELEELNSSLPEKLKKSVLQEAIQGRLVPQDTTDEPASVLIERIRMEKERLVKEGKLKKKDLESKPIEEDEIPFEIPKGWEWVRLNNICWLVNGNKSNGESLPNLDAKYLRGKSSATYLKSGVVVVPSQKVILVDGENSGEVFDVPQRGYLGSTFKIMEIVSVIYEQYLDILLLKFKDLFRNNKKGAAIPHLNKDIFNNLPVPLPPLPEQRRIVAKIEELFAQIDKLKA